MWRIINSDKVAIEIFAFSTERWTIGNLGHWQSGGRGKVRGKHLFKDRFSFLGLYV